MEASVGEIIFFFINYYLYIAFNTKRCKGNIYCANNGIFIGTTRYRAS